MDVNQTYREKQRLLANILPWWQKNGWRKSTLEAKSLRELLAIQSRMASGK